MPAVFPSLSTAAASERLFEAVLLKWIPAEAKALAIGAARHAPLMSEVGIRVVITAGAAFEGADALTLERIPVRFPLDKADRERMGEGLRRSAFDAVVFDGMSEALTSEMLHELVREADLALGTSGIAIVSAADGLFAGSFPEEHVIALFERFGFALAERKSAGSPVSAAAMLVFVRDAARVRARKSLQGLLEQDRKTTTYKFALIKALAEINIANAARVRYLTPSDMKDYLQRAGLESAPHQAAIPTGLVIERVAALYWQIYRARALSDDAPLPAQIGGGRRLEFEKPLSDLIRLYRGDWLSFRNDFYLGKLLAGTPRAEAFLLLARAIRKALSRGPVFYSRNSLGEDSSASGSSDDSAGNRLFRMENGEGFRAIGSSVTPAELDRAAGLLYLPSELWRELNVSAPWLSEAAMIRWAKLSADFSKGSFTPGAVIDLMEAPEDVRDTTMSRTLFLEKIRADSLRSVWSDVQLTKGTLAVDHMIPWARTHTNDLWNLVPAETKENGEKSDAVPSAACLDRAADRIIEVWRLYDHADAGLLFRAQAASTLFGKPLPQTHWETPLMDALMRSADETALQYACRRWEPDAADARSS